MAASTYEEELQEDLVRTNSVDPVLISRLLEYVGKRKGLAALAFCLTFVSACFTLLAPILIAAAVDVLFTQHGGGAIGLLAWVGLGDTVEALRVSGDKGEILLWFAGCYAASVVLQFLTDWANGYLLARMSQDILLDIRMDVFRHISTRSMRFFSRNKVGRLITRVTNDVGALDDFFSQALLAVLKDFMLLAGIVVLLLLADWQLGLITLSVLPPMVVISLIFRHYSRKAYAKWRAALSNLNAIIAETVGGVRVVQLFRRESRNQEKYEVVGEEFRSQFMKQRLAWAYYRPGYTILQATAMGLVLWFGGAWVLMGRGGEVFTAGMLTLFVLLAEKFFQPIRDLVEKFDVIQGAVTSAERIFTVLDEPDAIPEKPGAVVLPRAQGRIEFQDVHFAYNASEPVLRGVSFAAEPGQMIAVVGHTGAGKSTLINLLSRFYDVDSGRVLVDGVDVRDCTLKSLRRNIAVVHQEVFLFAGTVRENLALGNPGISDEDVVKAAKAVNAHGFISRLPGGYDHVVQEQGRTFSAGERQLLSFARALAADPAVLVLDEATSAIDTKSELLIQEAMKTLMKGRTSIVIAHRLSTIQSADCILVLHHGHVAEAGTHQQLLARRGLYHKLYELQFSGAHATGAAGSSRRAAAARV